MCQIAIVSILFLITACDCKSPEPSSAAAGTGQASGAPAAGGGAAASEASAAQPSSSGQPKPSTNQSGPGVVVFLDKEECCDCTRKAINATWDALQSAIAGKDIAVERMHVDTQPEVAEAYKGYQPIMAVPALYFMSSDGAFLKSVQGEQTEAQLRAELL